MLDPESYCRDVEAYLCRKNDGHLIRIVGPAFEQVSRWAQQGVPLKVAYAGIDRYFERYYRKGPRRRPVRVEFCEADVLDCFDGWRRAIGVAIAIGDGSSGSLGDGESNPTRRRASLATHVERTIAKLTVLRASTACAPELSSILETTARSLGVLQPEAKHARGEAREAVVAQLAALDAALLTAATEALDQHARAAGDAEVREALAPFRDRMAPTAYQQARMAALHRYVRDHFRLPTLTYDR
jgi:hypothetical protein